MGFYDSGNPATNTAAPSGALSQAGWQYQGYFGGFLGTVIGQNEFITARHIGVQSSNFVSDSLFTGGITQVHQIDSAANGGLGYYDIAGTDLRVYRVLEPFSSWAPLYTGSSEVGSDIFVTGRGGPRGAGIAGGWLLNSSDGVARWGENQVTSIASFSGLGQMLTVDFDAISGENEAFLSVGDSGGATFLNTGGQWELAGIHYAIDGPFSASPTGSSPFYAALHNASGYYAQSAPGVWVPISGSSAFYDSRISSNAAAIQSLVTVPEPSCGILSLSSAAVFLRRQRGARTLVRISHTGGLKSALLAASKPFAATSLWLVCAIARWGGSLRVKEIPRIAGHYHSCARCKGEVAAHSLNPLPKP